MLQKFYHAATEVNKLLKEKSYSSKTLAEHQRYVELFGSYLQKKQLLYSHEVMVEWLESNQSLWSHDTYNRYRRSAYRLERYLSDGTIDAGLSQGSGLYSYHDLSIKYIDMTEEYKRLLYSYIENVSLRLSKSTREQYKPACIRFLLFLQKNNCFSSESIDVKLIIQYKNELNSLPLSKSTNCKHRNAVSDFLKYQAKSGIIPFCYSKIMTVFNSIADSVFISEEKLYGYERIRHPSLKLEPVKDKFMKDLISHKYHSEPWEQYNWIFTQFFLFLEINQLAYSESAILLWKKSIQKDVYWKRKAKPVEWFHTYFRTGELCPFTGEQRIQKMHLLPQWCQDILYEYITLKQQEGLSSSAQAMYKNAGTRFFKFLTEQGVSSCKEITSDHVMEFHKTDSHETINSKNAYSCRIRKILYYMAEKGMVSDNLALAVFTSRIQEVKIPKILTNEMINTFFQYRKEASTPMELRSSALIMMGLRLGLRESDITNLRFENINWKSCTLSITQTKTRKQITLPIPTDVLNSLYLYITKGRPSPGKNGEGYIFIKHRAPYDKLSPSSCCSTLKMILALANLELGYREGFHITRKTFATKLLQSKVGMDRIVDALGHSTQESVHAYLSIDAVGMKMCAMPFSIVEGGFYEKI